ncbi:carboxypeptidase-like regulatory domain-containing protein [Dawidia soli]|uniref:Carboxypeptidase regulatory-like domain-containing protein n=1 Tax=Dawidia soli TaxID=2782352 RepID=A0AAP2DG44_9BACT|nr:carboxypeptidase-like regulatory domain-containing protein [Dawidia soli]MBT1690055.1 carboxypeptidase regulatory-like domain-containing protein [Dawidia soli]
MMYTLQTSLPARLLTFAWLLMLSFVACQNDDTDNPDKPLEQEDPLKPRPAISTRLSGTVVDESGEPLAGVTVRAHGQTVVTGADGAFLFSEVGMPANRGVVAAEKDGYYPAIRGVVPVKDNSTHVRLVLMSDAATHSLDAAAGGDAVLANGSGVTLPPQGIVTADGQAYSGTVNLSVRYLDSSSPGFARVVPGGDMLARRADESTALLYSYGILRVLLTTSAGEPLQLAPGKPATLTVTIPESQRATAPASIPLWYFDEDAGVWVEDGSAVKTGDKYIGTVHHFTDWNCDDPKDRATVIGEVVDCSGNPIQMGEVLAGQSSSDIGNYVTVDNTGGSGQTEFAITVPAETPLFVMVPKPFGLGTGEGGDLVMVPVPPLSPGQVYNVGKIQPHPCPSSASGSFKLAPGERVTSVAFRVTDAGPNEGLGNGVQRIFNPPTAFSFTPFPPEATLSMAITTSSGAVFTKVFETPAAGQNADLGEIDLTDAAGLVTAHGVASCGDTPLNGAAIRASWQGGNATATSNSVGVFSFSVPANTPVVMSVTHEEHMETRSFQSTAGDTYALGVVDLCAPKVFENDFTLNGDGFVNVLHTIPVQGDEGVALGFYSENEDITSIVVQNAANTLSMTLEFENFGVGQRPASVVRQAVVGRNVDDQWTFYVSDPATETGSYTVNVTKYDGPGGRIEGTFEGTFYRDDTVPVTVHGNFRVHRAF